MMSLGRLVRGAQRAVGQFAASSVECQRCLNTQTQEAPSRVEKTVNQVTLLGRVGGEPQKRGTEEKPVVIFSLATHFNYQYGTGDMIQKVDWHRICVFKPYLRDTVYRYLTKGQRVLVQGKISYGEVKDDSGNSQTVTSIVADDVLFLQKPAGRDSDNFEV